MQVENKIFCDWDLVRFVDERHLRSENGKSQTLSVTANGNLELMIFLGKDDLSQEFEAKVYKAKATDKYTHHEYDNVKRYEENDEYATFFFNDFDSARDFVYYLGYRHEEYVTRPVRRIESK